MSKNHTGINQEITEFKRVNPGLQRLSLETETSTKLSRVKPRLDKLNQEIKRG